VLLAKVLWFPTSSAAQTATTYSNESAFVAAIRGATAVLEEFEGEPPWNAVRSTIVGGIHAAPSVTSNGITWQSNHAANGITTGGGAALNGDWGIYSVPHGDHSVGLNDRLHDGLAGSSAAPMTAVGGWFTGTANSDLVVLLDGGAEISLGPVDNSFQFYGVVVTGGTFTSFEFREIEGTLEDQRLIFADDFTIAGDFAAMPTPTSTPSATWTELPSTETPPPSPSTTATPTTVPSTAAGTPTETATASPSPPSTGTSSPTATRSLGMQTPTATTPAVAECRGDCDANGSVTVDELVLSVNIALGLADAAACAAGDGNADGRITIDELVQGVNVALAGC